MIEWRLSVQKATRARAKQIPSKGTSAKSPPRKISSVYYLEKTKNQPEQLLGFRMLLVIRNEASLLHPRKTRISWKVIRSSGHSSVARLEAMMTWWMARDPGAVGSRGRFGWGGWWWVCHLKKPVFACFWPVCSLFTSYLLFALHFLIYIRFDILKWCFFACWRVFVMFSFAFQAARSRFFIHPMGHGMCPFFGGFSGELFFLKIHH